MKRLVALAAVLLAASCAAQQTPGVVTHLVAGDAATALIAGQNIDWVTQTSPAGEGQDPLVRLTLRHTDGRALEFSEANHTPNDVMAQAPGGPLAQIMGLFGEESPTLYERIVVSGSGDPAPFICGADGPVALGVHETADGAIQVVGLKQTIEFETLRDGTQAALPYSPDMVCARLTFRRS